ncbi:MAG: O-antigen ligase family protein [Candidatus Komeilibacteria bacterium]|nr:O-antigen ligase family protein [Candidatus Komeilibacteria bacterium]
MDVRNIIPKRVAPWIVVFFAADILSLAAYTIPSLRVLFFIIAAASILCLFFMDRRWLLFLPLAELMWGSFGSSFSWDIGGFRLSMRMLIFILAIGAWLGLSGVRSSIDLLRRNAFISGLFVSLVFITVWGFSIGLRAARPLSDVFLDGNAYLYLAYFPVWLFAYRREDLAFIRALAVGAAIATALKTLILFHLFANAYETWNIPYLYLWVRDTRIGELTLVGETLWRIFIQSQVFVGVVMVQSLLLLVWRGVSQRRLAALILCSAAILASFSRSYWLGALAAVVLFFVFFGRQVIRNCGMAAKRVGIVMAGGVAAVLLLMLLAILPYGGTGLSASLSARITSVSEPAVSSRLQLLRPLMSAIRVHPIIGSGFGASVSYRSDDPRTKNALNPSGTVTTYAFEWGYLDQWLKLGLIGGVVYLGVLLGLLYRGWRMVRANPGSSEISVMLLTGLAFIMIVHSASPYLNHPLGLGYLMLTMLVLGGKVNTDEKSNYQPRYL